MKAGLSLCAILLLAASVSCTLTIIKPKSLAQKMQSIQYSLANYGITPYGQTFYGTVVFSDPVNGCSSISEKKFSDFDRADDEEEQENQVSEPTINSVGSNSPIYLIQRGNCTFVQKSRNAQNSNGKVAIIYDDRPNEGVNDIILMDSSDHSGKGLMISTVFIEQSSALKLKEYLEENPEEKIVLKFQFQRPQGRNENKVKFWMSSLDTQSYQFLLNFKNHYDQLLKDGVALYFTPHYITQSDSDINKQKEHCVSNGKYCSPEYKIGGSDLHSREVVMEDIRQLILFNQNEALWWDYIMHFYDNCLGKPVQQIEACSYEQIKTIVERDSIFQAIKSIFKNSFLVKPGVAPDYATMENILLEKEKKKQFEQAVSMLPTLIFNGEYFRGDTSSDAAIYEFICSGFSVQPKSCFGSYNEWINFKNREIHESFKQESGGLNNTYIFILIITALVIIMYVVLLCYRRSIKNEMQKDMGAQVNQAVSNYFMLNDTRSKN